MEEFSDKQNEAFKNLFPHLQAKADTFTVKAHALIEFDDDNFTKLYTDPKSRIEGTEEEMKTVHARAKYLELI